jgi:hypothetical protein
MRCLEKTSPVTYLILHVDRAMLKRLPGNWRIVCLVYDSSLCFNDIQNPLVDAGNDLIFDLLREGRIDFLHSCDDLPKELGDHFEVMNGHTYRFVRPLRSL